MTRNSYVLPKIFLKSLKLKLFAGILRCEPLSTSINMEFTQLQRSWLVRTTAADKFPELDAESIAILQKGYAEMSERQEQEWKVKFDNYIAKSRELKAAEEKDAQDDTDKYFRSIFDKQNAKARELESKEKAAEESKDA